jgi:protease-4
LSTGFGNEAFSYGLGYGWSSGDLSAFRREKLLTSGIIFRPSALISIGLVGNFSTESNNKEGITEIGLRPFSNKKLTLFADAAFQNDTKLSDAPWSSGAVFEIISGINLIGRYFNNKAFTVGLTFSFGKQGLATQIHYNKDRVFSFNSYLLRLGGIRSSFLFNKIGKDKKYLALKYQGQIDYLNYKFFDKETLRLMDVLQDIHLAAQDPTIKTIALNLSGLRIRPENAWEIREELKKAQASGKLVIAFIDRAGMTGYHLASVADKIVMDPEGNLMLPGFSLGNTYFKGTLEKLGLGFDEWRFFKYKSAAEVLSREKMSDADREQRQAYLDDWYDLIKQDVCLSRGLSKEEYDKIIDDLVFLLPENAITLGLIDTLGRWSAKEEIVSTLSQKKLSVLSSKDLSEKNMVSEKWGEKSKIAVVYGLGECALDSGIKARWLENIFLKLAKKSSIKAVVFRVDSPGGDGMASDLVAEALRICKKEKPVVVSQGQVAGSGGYWISMYGDEIVAGPNTITGSIGVIGGWIYDKGFSKKIGMTSDVVTRGKHADVGYGIRLPFIGTQVPARNLTSDERTKVEKIIEEYYDVFIKKVSLGRNMSEIEVRRIAEGRFYSGLDGKDLGLIDKIGGLLDAIAIARGMTDIPDSEKIDLIEIPKSKGLFELFPFTSPIQTKEKDMVIKYLNLFEANFGKPLPMMLPGSYPEFEK